MLKLLLAMGIWKGSWRTKSGETELAASARLKRFTIQPVAAARWKKRTYSPYPYRDYSVVLGSKAYPLWRWDLTDESRTTRHRSLKSCKRLSAEFNEYYKSSFVGYRVWVTTTDTKFIRKSYMLEDIWTAGESKVANGLAGREFGIICATMPDDMSFAVEVVVIHGSRKRR